jgi:2-polyprenyl-6-methoxyphenol hydroxylase-like FAD-dependent oxidoreductase
MFGSAVQYGDLDTRERALVSTGGTLAGARESALDDREEYVMWGFTARRERFALPEGDEAFDGQDLKLAVERLMGDWHPALRRLVQRTAPSVIKTFAVKTSVPVGPWKTRNVTLLGDALHNMPPFRGVGANTALWDAAALHKALVGVDNGEKDLLKALAAYERAMIDHGFRAVRTSLRDMARFHAENRIERTLTKFFFRAVDLVPGLRNAVVAGR